MARAFGLRSLRLPQQIVFIEALDFATAEALIPDLKLCAEGFGHAQVLNGKTERLSRRREMAILGDSPSLAWRGTFSRCMVVE